MQEYGTHLVQNVFLKAFETGLRDKNLLTNIRPVDRLKSNSDEDLMKLVNELSSVQTQCRLTIVTQGKLHAVSTNIEHESLDKSSTTTDHLGRAIGEIRNCGRNWHIYRERKYAEREYAGKFESVPGGIKEIPLDGLCEEQKERVIQLLVAQQDAFATNIEDVGSVPLLKMHINLKNNIPVQKNYLSVPRHLYN